MAKDTLTMEELESKKDAFQKTLEIASSELSLHDNKDADKLDRYLINFIKHGIKYRHKRYT